MYVMYVCNVCVSGQGLIHAGALVYLTDSLRSMKSPLNAYVDLIPTNTHARKN